MSANAIKLRKDEAQQISDNLRYLLKKNNLSINQIAQAIDMPMMTVRRLMSGETADPRISTLKILADHFGITIDSLLENDHHAFIPVSKKIKPRFVPILTWDIVEKINSINDLDLDSWQVWQPISLSKHTISKHAFALESRPSMYPRYPNGTIFIIDPDIAPTDGDIVLVKIIENNELTLRQLSVDPPEWKLHPIVSGSHVLEYSEKNYKIVGINLLTLLYNRRIYS